MLIENTISPLKEKTYEVMDGVMTEVAQLFPGAYIHVGGDECYKEYWKQCPEYEEFMKREKLHDLEQVQSYFMKRMEKILKNKGKKLIGWDEILEGGLAPEAAVMSWRGMKGGIEAAKEGHAVVMTPTEFCYLDYMQSDRSLEPQIYASLTLSKAYSFEPTPEGVNPALILGGQGNLWSEEVPTMRHAEYMTWPRGLALAEVFWSPKTSKNWPDFLKRTETQFQRLDAAGINYAHSVYNPGVVVKAGEDGGLSLELTTEVPDATVFYTIDNTFPDPTTTRYTQPVALPKWPYTLRAQVFRDGKALGRLLTLTQDELAKRAKKK
jgi:hexosaminidase